KCFGCHGPDSAGRRAGLRVDDEASAKAKVIVSGDVGHSLLIDRITATDPKRRMPFGKDPLSAREIALLRKWIEQGAKYEPHWAFIRPERPAVPSVTSTWPKNDIDRFVLDRLTREGLTPSPEADRPTLIRRVSLDLTGLPPTIGEVEAFLADKS